MSYNKFIDNIFIENNQYNSYIYQNNKELFLFPDYSIENNINIYNVNNLISNIEVDFLSNIQLYDEIDYTEYLFIKNHNVTDNIYLVNKSLSIIVNINKLTKILTKTNINEKINYSLDNSFSEINTKTSKSILYNDNIYITPFNSQVINIININDNSIQNQIDIINYTIFNDNNYSDAIMVDSKIYYIPYDANNIGILYLNTNSFNVINSPYINQNKSKYKKGILYNNYIYCIPYNSGNIGVININNNTFSIIYDDNLIFKLQDLYSTAILANDKIYFIPSRADNIFIFDPNNINEYNIYTLKNTGIYMNTNKFIDAVLDNNNIYLIPYKTSEFCLYNFINNTFTILFNFNEKEPLFSKGLIDKTNKYIYMIPGNGNYLAILKEPYNNITYLHSLKTNQTNQYFTDGLLNNSKLYLISKYNSTNIYEININLSNYNYIGFDNNYDFNINTITSINDSKYIYRNYYSGILINNFIYMIENNGLYLSKIDLTNNNITDIQILPLEFIDRNIIAYSDLETTNDYLYTILAKFNTIIEFNTINNTIDYFNLNNYDVTNFKFIKGIYSNLKNAIYMIPYHIIGIGILHLNSRTYEFIKFDELNPSLNRPFFNNGVIIGSYLYLIPCNENYIYIYNLITGVYNTLDISNRNFNTNKYTGSFIIDNFTYLFPNKSEKIGKLCYDVGINTILEGTADFELISKDVYNKTKTNEYKLDRLNVGINTFYSATYKYGIIIPSIFTENEDSSNISFKWEYQKANEYHNGEFNVTVNTLTNDQNNDTILNIFQGLIQGNLVEFNINLLVNSQNNKFVNSFVNSIYDINTGNIILIPYNLKHLICLNVNNEIPELKIRSIQKTNDIESSLSKYINQEDDKIISSIIIDEYLYMITYTTTNNAGLEYIPFIIYNLNQNTSEELNIFNKTQGAKIKSFKKIVYSSNINTLFLIPYNHQTIVYYSINDKTLGEVSLFDFENNQNLGFSFLTNETGRNNNFFFDSIIINNFIYLFTSDGSKILKYEIRTYYEFTKYNNSILIINNSIYTNLYKDVENKFCKIIHYTEPIYLKINYIYLIPHNLNQIIIYNIDTHTIVNNYPTITNGLNISNNNYKFFKDAILININFSDVNPIPEPYIFLVPYNAFKLIKYNIIANKFEYSSEPIFNYNLFSSGIVDHKGNIYFIINDGYILYYKFKVIKKYIKPRLPVSFSNGIVSLSKIYKKFNKAYVYSNYNYNNKKIRLSDYYRNGGFTYFTKNKINENKFILDIEEINCNINEANNLQNYINQETLFIQDQSSNLLEYNKFTNLYTERYTNFIDQQTNINSINIQNDNTFLYYFTTINKGNILNIFNIETGLPVNIINFDIVNKIEKFFYDVDIVIDKDINYQINSNLNNKLQEIVVIDLFTEIRFNLYQNRNFNNHLNINTSIFQPLLFTNTINFVINGNLNLGLSVNNNINNSNISIININLLENSKVFPNYYQDINILFLDSLTNYSTWDNINDTIINNHLILPSFQQLNNFINNTLFHNYQYDYSNLWIPIFNPLINAPYKDFIYFNSNNTFELLSTDYYSNLNINSSYNNGQYLSSLETYGNFKLSTQDIKYFSTSSIDFLKIDSYKSWDNYKYFVESNFGRLPYSNEVTDLIQKINLDIILKILKSDIMDTSNKTIWIPIYDYIGAYMILQYNNTNLLLKTPFRNENYYINDILNKQTSDYQQPDFNIQYSYDIIDSNLLPTNYILYIPNFNIVEISDNFNNVQIDLFSFIVEFYKMNINTEPFKLTNHILFNNNLKKYEKLLELEVNINYQITKNTEIDINTIISQFQYIHIIHFNIKEKMLDDVFINFTEVTNININDIDIIINYNYL